MLCAIIINWENIRGRRKKIADAKAVYGEPDTFLVTEQVLRFLRLKLADFQSDEIVFDGQIY
jgi:hypothetical protein